MFQFCGMSFADLAHLEKSALDQNILRYSRIKTKTPMSVEILDTAEEMISQLLNHQPSLRIVPTICSISFRVTRSVRMNVLTVNTSPPFAGSITI